MRQATRPRLSIPELSWQSLASTSSARPICSSARLTPVLAVHALPSYSPCHTSPSRRRFASLNTDYWDHYSPSRSRSPVIGKPTSGDHLTKDQAVETPGPWLIDLGVEQEEDQYDHDMTQENGEGSSTSASIKWATDGPWIDPGDWPPVSAEDAGMVDGQFGNDLASVAAPAESNDEAAGAGVLAALQDWQASPAAIRWALQEYIPVTALPSTDGAVPRDEWVWVAGGVVQARYLEFQEMRPSRPRRVLAS